MCVICVYTYTHVKYHKVVNLDIMPGDTFLFVIFLKYSLPSNTDAYLLQIKASLGVTVTLNKSIIYQEKKIY